MASAIAAFQIAFVFILTVPSFGRSHARLSNCKFHFMEVFLSLFWICKTESSEAANVPAKKSENGEQPLDRALAVLSGVVAAARPVSVTEIAASCALPVPTAHR